MACEQPADSHVPLARRSSAELAREVVARGICEQISGVTACEEQWNEKCR